MKPTRSLFTLLALGALAFGLTTALRPGLTPLASAQTVIAPIDEPQALLEDELNTISIVEQFGPSVVAVNVEVRGQRVDPFSDIPFFEQLPPQFRDLIPRFQMPERRQGSGSGFVVDEAGRIATNYHVVEPALQPGSTTLREGASIRVVFTGNESQELPVRVVGANALYDLALLELEDPGALPAEALPIPLADSDQVRVGQKTVAIGNPFGFQSTVTTGIVSGVGRSLPGIGQTDIPLIQTDAAINPGNSGGPLLNSRGELIGINTAIIPTVSASGQRGFLGIGFAVPSNLLRDNLAELEQGVFRDIVTDLAARPRLGVSLPLAVGDYPESVRASLRLPEQGVVIGQVEPSGPADKAGLIGPQFAITAEGRSWPVGGDIITAIDGTPVNSLEEVRAIVFNHQVGDRLTLTVWRDGRERQVVVTLEIVPLPPAN